MDVSFFLHLFAFSFTKFVSLLNMRFMIDNREQDLENEKRELLLKIEAAHTRLREINNQLNSVDVLSELWIKKTFTALRYFDTPLSTIDILESIFPASSFELQNPICRKNNILKLSTILNRLCKKGDLFGKKYDGYKGNLYFLMDWIQTSDDEKIINIKTEYEYKAMDKIGKTIAYKKRFDYA